MGALFGKSGPSSAATNVQNDINSVNQANAQVAAQKQASDFASQQAASQAAFQTELDKENSIAQRNAKLNPLLSAGGFFGAAAARNTYLASGTQRNTFLGA